MRNKTALGLVVLSVFASGCASAAHQLEGEILDLASYIPKRAKGPTHLKRMEASADTALGLLTDDDVVYVLYPRNGREQSFEAVKRLAGRRARLTGVVAERGALHGFEVMRAVAA